ncbi:14837_t:CDS:2 [Acaulospora morrowiae]|uniref:14837_t:CDS:1 n=1 Tax=Acaulospora morrowiae TaxID=94023 RepID=A0A9N9HIL1_9GLOM|nr:14837_t:CDS:2 [Acaulospora morrowiae]
MASAFLKKNLALAPLFVASGVGVFGSLTYALYTLTYSPEVVVNRSNQQPWNLIQQHENHKMITINKEFFEKRRGVDSPSKSF